MKYDVYNSRSGQRSNRGCTEAEARALCEALNWWQAEQLCIRLGLPMPSSVQGPFYPRKSRPPKTGRRRQVRRN